MWNKQSLRRMSIGGYVIASCASILCLGSGSAAAQDTRAYAKQVLPFSDSRIMGGSYRAVMGHEHLGVPAPSLDTKKIIFIAKTMWLNDYAGSWLELGALKGYTSADGGNTSTEYWVGNYYGWQRIINVATKEKEFRRFFVGTYGESGNPRNLSIEPGGTTASGKFIWDFYRDDELVGSIDHPKAGFIAMEVGMESNQGCTNYSNGTVSDVLFYFGPTVANPSVREWQLWPSAQSSPPSTLTSGKVTDLDNKKNPAWDSTYNPTDRSIKYQTTPPTGCPPVTFIAPPRPK